MNLQNQKCVPCEGGTAPLTVEKEQEYLDYLSQWAIDRDETHKINKEFKFAGFLEAIAFVNKLAEIAEEEGHHPNISIYYNRVLIELYTHAIGGLSINDFIIASKIDHL